MVVPCQQTVAQAGVNDARHSTHKSKGAFEAASMVKQVVRHRKPAKRKRGRATRYDVRGSAAKKIKPVVGSGASAVVTERVSDQETVATSRSEGAAPIGAPVSAAPIVARTTASELAAIAKTYCSNNAADAAEARVARRQKKLAELGEEVARKSAALVALAQEARTWVERREGLWSSTRDVLVETYAKMKPEAAAQQLAAMSEETATSIIMKLNARAASAILNEMGADRAAHLADLALRRGSSAARQTKSGT